MKELIVQGVVIGREQQVAIGSGNTGNTHVSLSHPERKSVIVALDPATGDMHFLRAQSTEQQAKGTIHAFDFPALSPGDAGAVERTAAANTYRNVQHARREMWPIGKNQGGRAWKLRQLAQGGLLEKLRKEYGLLVEQTESVPPSKPKRKRIVGPDGITF